MSILALWTLIVISTSGPPTPVYGFETESACITAGRKTEDAYSAVAHQGDKERIRFLCVKTK
jgi:hypothetical protein